MGLRRHLIDKNYFPYKGKAYCEDLIHSLLLKRKGVKLYVLCKTEVVIQPTPSPTILTPLELFKSIRARYYYSKLAGLNLFWVSSYLTYISLRFSGK